LEKLLEFGYMLHQDVVCPIRGGNVWVRLRDWRESHELLQSFGREIVLRRQENCARATASFPRRQALRRQTQLEAELGFPTRTFTADFCDAITINASSKNGV